MKLKRQNFKNNNKYFNTYLKEDFDMLKILNLNVLKKNFFKNLNISIFQIFSFRKNGFFLMSKKIRTNGILPSQWNIILWT